MVLFDNSGLFSTKVVSLFHFLGSIGDPVVGMETKKAQGSHNHRKKGHRKSAVMERHSTLNVIGVCNERIASGCAITRLVNLVLWVLCYRSACSPIHLLPAHHIAVGTGKLIMASTALVPLPIKNLSKGQRCGSLEFIGRPTISIEDHPRLSIYFQ